jgi:hypothetical protein
MISLAAGGPANKMAVSAHLPHQADDHGGSIDLKEAGFLAPIYASL